MNAFVISLFLRRVHLQSQPSPRQSVIERLGEALLLFDSVGFNVYTEYFRLALDAPHICVKSLEWVLLLSYAVTTMLKSGPL